MDDREAQREARRKEFWDVTKWEVSKILQWMYVIEERSDRLISHGMYTDDWTEHDDDEKMHEKLAGELKRRGL